MKHLNLTILPLLLSLLAPSANAQACLQADGFENNNSCQTATLPGGNFCQFGLSIDIGDADWFGWTVAPGERLTIDVRAHDDMADLRSRLFDGCSQTVLGLDLSVGSTTQLSWDNTTGASKAVVLHLFAAAQAPVTCTFYDITAVTLTATPGCLNDALEPNNCCDIAVELAEGIYDLTLQLGNQDWFEVTVPAGEQLDIFGSGTKPLDINLWEDCFGTFVDDDPNHLSVTNISASPKSYLLQLTSVGVVDTCFDYMLQIEMSPNTITHVCNGNGGVSPGCTNCPCGNNNLPNFLGGCVHSNGEPAYLQLNGMPTASVSSLSFRLTQAVPFTFAVLLSGDDVAPGNPANPCFGLRSGVQSTAFDGLRCVIGNVQRHGGRACDANGDMGVTTPRWGPPNGPPIGLIAQGGFVVGQSRYWQAVYRDNPLLSCGRGLNTSQAVLTIITP